jgi:hypothetical protein
MLCVSEAVKHLPRAICNCLRRHIQPAAAHQRRISSVIAGQNHCCYTPAKHQTAACRLNPSFSLDAAIISGVRISPAARAAAIKSPPDSAAATLSAGRAGASCLRSGKELPVKGRQTRNALGPARVCGATSPDRRVRRACSELARVLRALRPALGDIRDSIVIDRAQSRCEEAWRALEQHASEHRCGALTENRSNQTLTLAIKNEDSR